MRVLVTGGAGFIGSNFIRLILANHPDWEVVSLDKLTYAGNLANLAEVENDPRYRFLHGDICDAEAVAAAMAGCQAVVNFAAETHVDRSLADQAVFLRTDVLGVQVLLEQARKEAVSRFIQISTDEVYGPVEQGSFTEGDGLNPRNPYSASKAGGELLARSYWFSFQAPVLATRGCNTLGPYQHPEKVIPLFLTNALEGRELPLYGDGLQRREWLYVEDHCRAIELLLERGEPGEVYNVSSGEETTNLELSRLLLKLVGRPESLIRHVEDRPGHDRRYSVDSSKLRALGWRPRHNFEQALGLTVEWYRSHRDWWEKTKAGEFRDYYRRHYGIE